MKGASQPSPKAIPPGAMMPNGSLPGNGSAPMNPMPATMLQRHQDEQNLLAARLMMQQRQADQSLLAAAMAAASNNLMAGAQIPSLDPQQYALLYQQALMSGRGAAGILPPVGAAYGSLVPPSGVPGVSQPPPNNNMMMAAAPPQGSSSIEAKPNNKKSSKASKKKETKKEKTDFYKTQKYEDYFDGSTYPDPRTDEEEDNEPETIKDPQKEYKGKWNEAFPIKLYRMIVDAKNNGQEDIISFFPHGRAFGIHKPREFISEIMPKYLTTTRMSSFQRQLNLCKLQMCAGSFVKMF